MGLKNLPSASGHRHARAFERLGFSPRETTGRNPHIIMTKPGFPHPLAIPNHKGKDVKRVIIASLIKLAGITEAEYLKAFK